MYGTIDEYHDHNSFLQQKIRWIEHVYVLYYQVLYTFHPVELYNKVF